MIVIANRGGCPRKAIELIGVTSKRGADGKHKPNNVGIFGSGTAYAIALALRRGATVTISSQDDEGPYTCEPWLKSVNLPGDFDAQPRQVMLRFKPGSPLVSSWWASAVKAMGRARSLPTSFTDGLGDIGWEGAFPIVREFVTNARDADPDGYRVWTSNQYVDAYAREADIEGGFDAITVVTIDGDREADLIVSDKWHEDFRWTCKGGPYPRLPTWWMDVFLRDDLERVMADPNMGSLMVYVRGVLCEHGIKTHASYSWSLNVALTEERRIKSQFDIGWQAFLVASEAARRRDPFAVEILKTIIDDASCWEASIAHEYGGFESHAGWREAFVTAFSDRAVMTRSGPANVQREKDAKARGYAVVEVPQQWYNALSKMGVPTIHTADGLAPGVELALPDDVMQRITGMATAALERSHGFDSNVKFANLGNDDLVAKSDEDIVVSAKAPEGADERELLIKVTSAMLSASQTKDNVVRRAAEFSLAEESDVAKLLNDYPNAVDTIRDALLEYSQVCDDESVIDNAREFLDALEELA